MSFHKHFGIWEGFTLGVLSEGKQLLQLDSDQHFLKIQTTKRRADSLQDKTSTFHSSHLMI